MTFEEVYSRLLASLRSTQTSFAFIGALGAIAWGRPRATTDLDLVVVCDEHRFDTLRVALLATGFEQGAGVGPAEVADRRALAGSVIDWELARRWAVVWGIEAKLDALRPH